MPAPRKPRTGLPVTLAVLGVLLALGVTTTMAWYLTNRPTRVPVAAAPLSAAATTSAPAIPADQDPTKPEYAQSQLIRAIGGPAGFQTYRAPAWEGPILGAAYSLHCPQAKCPTDPVTAISTWAAGIGAVDFALKRLPGCLPSVCTTTVPKGSLSVRLSARANSDDSFVAQAGDVVYLVEVLVRRG